jgi:hypothetical protein
VSAKSLLAITLISSLVACAAAEIVPMGTDTYMISQTSAGGVFTNMATLKSEVIKRANAFAESKGKVAVPIAAREAPAVPGQRMPNFEYQFQLVDRNDPRAAGSGLVKTPDVLIENRGQAPAVTVNTGGKDASKSQDLYAELIKLDDLRKRGIITEAEFEAQKQKLLQGR